MQVEYSFGKAVLCKKKIIELADVIYLRTAILCHAVQYAHVQPNRCNWARLRTDVIGDCATRRALGHLQP